MSTDAPAGDRARTERCPACGARTRARASWCSLCHHDLRPQPLVPQSAAGPPATAVYEFAGPGQSSEGSGEGGDDGEAAAQSDPEQTHVAEELLDRLRAVEGNAGLPETLGAVRDRFGRMGLVAAGAVAIVLLLVGVPALVGLVV